MEGPGRRRAGGRLLTGEALREHFRRALAHAEAHDADFVAWVRSLGPVERVSQQHMIAEYVFVVSASGFRASVVQRRFGDLSRALRNLEMPGLATLREDEIRDVYMEKMLRNRAKAAAAARGVVLLENLFTVEMIKTRLAGGDVDVLKSLPFIGDTTKWHLARNLGLDVAKPDVHLTRLARRFGYGADVARMCAELAGAFGERVAAVDAILWSYASAGEPRAPSHAEASLDAVLAAIRAMRAPLISEEVDLHGMVAEALSAAGIPHEREYRLGPRERIDFLAWRHVPGRYAPVAEVGAVGIECKKGKPNGTRLLAQIRRYCGHREVASLVVVTPWRRHLPKVREVLGRPVVYVGLNELWGVAD